MSEPDRVLLIAVLITIVIFLVCRIFVLWYWRINEKLAVLHNIDDNLVLLIEELREGKGEAEEVEQVEEEYRPPQ